MNEIKREEIHIVSRHSNLTEQAIDRILSEKIYNSREAWQKFLQLSLLILSISFSVLGIIFFFAYNWADLHKFVKIGLVVGLISATVSVVLLSKWTVLVKKSMLTGASVLVGVLFAVFGQVYQTGANAYDFFLAWTVFITAWVIALNFAPLWLLYLILIHATFVLYVEQVAQNWSEVLDYTLLFSFNALALIASLLVSNYKKQASTTHWLQRIIALACATFGTTGMIIGIFQSMNKGVPPTLIVLVALVFGLSIWYGIKTKSLFYLSIPLFCLILITASVLVRLSSESHGDLFLLIGFFVIISVSLVITYLIKLQKKWKNGN